MTPALRALIEKWRLASTSPSVDEYYADGLEQCADELEAALAGVETPAPPDVRELRTATESTYAMPPAPSGEEPSR